LGQDLRRQVEGWARAEGFEAFGVTRPDAIPLAGERLDAFLIEGRHGDMDWMAAHADQRRSPAVLWPQARSVIMLGMNYGPDRDPLAVLAERSHGAISVYAQRRDYHDILKTKLKRIAGQFATLSGADVKVFVDTAPLMEKPLAQAAGLGWQGKHTNLVSRASGSWLFLGAILTVAELEPDAPEADHCGSCRRCLDACPTAAFPAPYELDARRCIAYLTIEHKGPIAAEFRAAIGNRVFGCDDCLAVCPWNKYATAAREVRLAVRDEADRPLLGALLALDDAAFRVRFAGTPVKRTGRDRFVRNVLIAAGNSGDRSLLGEVERLLGDHSALVRGMAVWALGRLGDAGEVRAMRERFEPGELDGDVLAEWGAVNELAPLDLPPRLDQPPPLTPPRKGEGNSRGGGSDG